MKVTALIPDKIIKDVKYLTQGKNITDSLIIALNEWISLQKIKNLNDEVKKNPLKFNEEFSAEQIRNINRRK